MFDTKLDNPQEFRPSRMKQIEDFFITEISDREYISKTLNKYITALDYAGKTLLVLPDASRDVPLCSFATVIITLVVIASASVNLVFFISNGIDQMFFKKIGNKKEKPKRLLYRLGVNLIA